MHHGDPGKTEERQESARPVELGEDALEVLERFTKRGHEVVNVDGLTFIRKRKRIDEDPKQAAKPCGQLGVQATPGPESTGTQAAPLLDTSGPPFLPGMTDNIGGPLIQEGPSAPKQPSITETAVELLPELQDLQPQDDGKELSPVPSNPQQEPQQQPVRELDFQAVVGNLLRFIPSGCPTAVAVKWLLRETLRVTVPPGDEAGAAAAATVLQGFQGGLEQHVATAQQLLLLGDPEHLQQFDKLPRMVRSMCATERHMACLRQQLKALQREEAEWLALEDKYRSGARCISCENASGVAATIVDAEEEEEPAGELHLGVATLESAQQRAELQVSMQVDVINAMLDQAELMVVRAQQTCANLQAEYHKENFQSYAHVNSPQVLVKVLSQAVPPAALDFVPASQPADSR